MVKMSVREEKPEFSLQGHDGLDVSVRLLPAITMRITCHCYLHIHLSFSISHSVYLPSLLSRQADSSWTGSMRFFLILSPEVFLDVGPEYSQLNLVCAIRQLVSRTGYGSSVDASVDSSIGLFRPLVVELRSWSLIKSFL